jgi:hypothetical protein
MTSLLTSWSSAILEQAAGKVAAVADFCYSPALDSPALDPSMGVRRRKPMKIYSKPRLMRLGQLRNRTRFSF